MKKVLVKLVEVFLSLFVFIVDVINIIPGQLMVLACYLMCCYKEWKWVEDIEKEKVNKQLDIMNELSEFILEQASTKKPISLKELEKMMEED